MNRLGIVVIIFGLSSFGSPLYADVRLPNIFHDHMVLQRDTPVPIWGTADPGEDVTVAINDSEASATAGPDGRWMVHLENLKADGRPVCLIVTAKNTVTFHDVLVGDVWVCSGQSNMLFALRLANNAGKEIPKANHLDIRLFTVPEKVAFDPQMDCDGYWQVCDPNAAAGFSAVGYFFGREINAIEKVPIGLIGTSVGGTPAQAWTRLQAMAADPELKAYADLYHQTRALLPEIAAAHARWEQQITTLPSAPEPARANSTNYPSVLYNAMIAPLQPYAIKGVIWYQGEGNTDYPQYYHRLFTAMIEDWRARWGQGDFPFLFVQLANYLPRKDHPGGSNYAMLREAQLQTLRSIPNTGMAVTIDIGLGEDIHPRDKIDVGHRLSLAARHIAYGESDLVYSGPIYDSMRIEGDQIRLRFKDCGSGLQIAAAPSTQPDVPSAKPDSELCGFAIAGPDQHWVWGKARIAGNDEVLVHSDEVMDPVAVRYGWADNPEVNLYNKEGLPASPFRTDTWAAGN